MRSRYFLWIWVTFKVIYLLPFQMRMRFFEELCSSWQDFSSDIAHLAVPLGQLSFLFMVALYVIRQTIYIFIPSFVLFFFPRLISAVGDWMFAILPHMAWPYCEFRMQVWNVLYAARWKSRTQKIAKKSPSGHHRTTLWGYVFATKACIDDRKKKLVKQQYVLDVPTIWWTSAH